MALNTMAACSRVTPDHLDAVDAVGLDEFLKGGSRSHDAASTCTFRGTANSNQMMTELIGLDVPKASFTTRTDPNDAETGASTMLATIEMEQA